MVADIKIQTKDQAVLAALASLRMALPLKGDMTPAMRDLARILKTGAQLRFRSQAGPDGERWKASRRVSEEGGQTLSLSGRLRRSLTTAASRTTATVGTNDIRAAIHQFGGVIRAKKGPFLSIPVTPAARRAGGASKFPSTLHVATTLKGQYILVDAEGTTQYILRAQVTMPARPFLGASDTDRTAMLTAMSDHLSAAWRR